MKILFSLFAFLLFSTSLIAQDNIGSVKRGSMLIADLSVKKGDTTNIYKLRFLDATSDILKSIEFNYTEKQLKELYLLLKGMLSEKNGTSKDIQIGKHSLNITTQKIMGLRNLAIQVNEEYRFGLNGRELDKLININE